MDIQIKLAETEYKISIDPACYSVYRLGTTKEGKPSESSVGHFVNISNAVKKIVQTHFAEIDEVVSLKDYASRIEVAYKTLISQVDL